MLIQHLYAHLFEPLLQSFGPVNPVFAKRSGSLGQHFMMYNLLA